MKKNILIVDDSTTARNFIRTCFKIAGFNEAEFSEAADGEEALKKLRNMNIRETDLIVTDLIMPVLDGKELLIRISEDPALNETPVLVITSKKNPVQERELIELGASAVLGKPITPAHILKSLQEIEKQISKGVRALQTTSLQEAVSAAVSETFENMSFMDVERKDEFCKEDMFEEWFWSAIEIKAPFKGSITFVCPKILVAEIHKQIFSLGEITDDDEILLDTIGEFINTISGRCMSFMLTDFDLGLPTTGKGWIDQRKKCTIWNYDLNHKYCFKISLCFEN